MPDIFVGLALFWAISFAHSFVRRTLFSGACVSIYLFNVRIKCSMPIKAALLMLFFRHWLYCDTSTNNRKLKIATERTMNIEWGKTNLAIDMTSNESINNFWHLATENRLLLLIVWTFHQLDFLLRNCLLNSLSVQFKFYLFFYLFLIKYFMCWVNHSTLLD